MEGARCAPRKSTMQTDLRFTSAALEQEFLKEAAMRSRKLGKQFYLNRSGIWAVVLLRVLASKEWAIAAAVLVVLLLPAVAHCLPSHTYLRWRTPLKVFDNLLQMALGCYTHHHIYPNPASGVPSTFQMAAVLLTGNGVPWQLFNSIWGSLPFRYALPQQAALTIMLLLFNRSLCSKNIPIQFAYTNLQRAISRRTSKLLSRVAAGSWAATYRAGRSCAAAILAAPPVAREAVRVACLNATTAAAAAQVQAEAEAAVGAPAAQAAQAAAQRGVDLCMRYQPISQLLLGFVLPTFLIWCTELRLRRAFLVQRSNNRGGSGSGSAGGSSAAHAPGLQHRRQQQQPAEAQQVAADEMYRVQANNDPGIVEYLMFAGPAVACMWSMVAV